MYRVELYLRVRRACLVDGMSIREPSGVFGLHRDTVRKMLAHSVPPGYRRRKPPTRPKIGPYTGVIDRILEDDPVSSTGQALNLPKKQRHTAKRIHERLRDEYGFDGGYTIVKDYVRKHRRRTREMFVPLVHPPGHAQCDFGEAWAVIGGVKQKIHFFVLDPWTDQVYEWLTADRLQVTRIHELLAGRGCRVSYTSSRRFIQRRAGRGEVRRLSGWPERTRRGGGDGLRSSGSDRGPRTRRRPAAGWPER